MKFYYKTLAFASLLALAACSDFDEMNTNRTNLLIHRVLLIPM